MDAGFGPEALPEPEPGYDPQWDARFSSVGPPLDGEAADWPRLSIVTPSFNQGRFIERTIRCILLQGYPNLEYIVIDGGSADETLRIIEKYAPWIDHRMSEADSGMYDALNKGFALATGEIMAWAPTGDLYEPGALCVVGQVFRQLPEVEWLTSLWKVKCDEAGQETARYRVEGFCRRSFRKGLHFPGGGPPARFSIAQQSTFWRRSLWKRAGARMDDCLKGAGDFELWARFSRHAEIHCLDRPVGLFMTHGGQMSVSHRELMLTEQWGAFRRHGDRAMTVFEVWLRRHVLSRRPLRWLWRVPGVGFQCLRWVWDDARRRVIFAPEWFV